jgi:hypothetical protein
VAGPDAPQPVPTPVSGAAERHRRHLERFLAEGRLVALTPRYAVVSRPAGDERRGLGCLVCGALSWHPGDVAARYCPRCKVWHDDG